jgi:hypothetical protein
MPSGKGSEWGGVKNKGKGKKDNQISKCEE